MQNNTYISDQFNTWKKCKKRYYYKYVKELSWPECGNDFKLGTSIHALINYYLKGFDITNLLSNADQDVLKCWNNIKDHSILKNKLTVSEWSFLSKFNVEGKNYWLNGRIDAVFYNKNANKYIIADWKTGNVPRNPDDNFQHLIYLYSFFNAQKDLGLSFSHENLVFQYFYINSSIEIVTYSYSENIENEVERTLAQSLKEIETSTGFIKPDLCPNKNCQYLLLCMMD